jgi:hypothetical protein
VVKRCQQQDRLKEVSDCLYVRDAMYSSYTSILLVVVTHCCLYSRYQQAEIGTSRHPALDKRWPTAEVWSIFISTAVRSDEVGIFQD